MKLRIVLIAIVTALFNTIALAADKVEIKNAWVREAPPMMKMLAGYMQIHNEGKKKVILRSADSKSFERIEIHRTEIHNGVAQMKPVSHVIVEPGKVVTFEPGSLHLMLINPVKPLKAGDKVEFTLNFSDGNSLNFDATVKKMNGMEGNSSRDMNRHDMKQDDHNDNNHESMHEDREDQMQEHSEQHHH